MPFAFAYQNIEITAGGGTTNLPVSDPIQIYKIYASGAVVLAASVVIQASGTPAQGMLYKFEADCTAVTLGANTFTVFGQSITQAQLSVQLNIEAYYNGSAWDVRVYPDIGGSAWIETDDLKDAAVTNTKIANMAALTVKGNATNSATAPQDISAASANTILRRNGGNILEFAKLDYEEIDNGVLMGKPGYTTSTIINTGTTSYIPGTNTVFQRITGTDTAVGAVVYRIDPTTVSAYAGHIIILDFDAALTLGANSLTIFGVSVPAALALSGGFSVIGYWDGSAQRGQLVEGYSGAALWEAGTGTNAVKQINAAAANTASGNSAVAIGRGNTASGNYSFAGGLTSTASGTYSTVIGNTSTSSGVNSFALGMNTTAAGNYSVALGIETVVNRMAQTSLSARGNAAAGYDQMTILHGTTSVSDATATNIMIGGNVERFTISNNSVVFFTGQVVAVQHSGAAGTTGDSATWHFNGCIKNIAGTTALVDTVGYQDVAFAWGAAAQRTQDAGAAAWTCVVSADNANDALQVQFTGEANKNIYVSCVLYMNEIKFAA